MAKEIRASSVADIGGNLYAIVINEAGNYWNVTTSAFVGFLASASVWGDYDIPLTESTGSGTFFADFPAHANTPRGRYSVEIRRREGASPAITDDVIASQIIYWTGGVGGVAIGLEDIEEDTTGLVAGTQVIGFAF